MKIAWLTSGNQVGFEVIEYVEPKSERRVDNFEYWKLGITHISVTDYDIEGCVKESLTVEVSKEVRFGR